MLVSGAPLVGAEHPSLQQRNGQVDTRQQFVAFRLMSLHLPIMNISLQFPVRIEAVGANGASGLNALPDEAMKGFAIKIWDTRHADTPIPLPSASAATIIIALFKTLRPVAPSDSIVPQYVSSTSTIPRSRSRPGLTMACRSLWSISQAVR